MTAASAVFSLRVHAKVCQWTSGDALAAREGRCRRLPRANSNTSSNELEEKPHWHEKLQFKLASG